ncbi:hybrid sensor histidine kinase/response regulator [Falsiroseomonas sp.]|uniref:hybrid sensor histidine kinase/response regulator n=1 Tax=Falsiroseomonas sp. TaxID=2870721 RepID=UPI003F6FAB76
MTLPRPARALLLLPAAAALGVVALAVAGPWPGEDSAPILAGLLLLQAAAALGAAWAWRRSARQAAADLAECTRRAEAEAQRQADGLRTQILSTAAHEVRTPLSGIVGLLELVLEQPGLPAAARVDVAASRQAALDLMTVLRDLIEVPGAALPPLADLPFRVDELMEQVVALLRARATARGNRLAVAVAAGTPPAWRGDPPRIRQILTNMVANAIRFTEGGEVRIEARQNAQGALELSVSDTGRGIAAERVATLFDRFQDSDGGTGLGLSICRDLAARMGGRIEVQSAPGRGSSFTVTLPLPQVAEALVPAAPAPPDAPPSPTPARPGPPVLVVDDVPVNRRLLGTLLARAGYAHEEAADAATALAMMQTRPYAAVLMDLHMPGIDGLEATRRLRALPGPAGRLPVLAVTAQAEAQGRQAAQAAGMDAYLVKPVAMAELARALEEAVRGRAVRS